MNNASTLVAPTVQDHLRTVQQAVNAINNPFTHEPLLIPDFSILMDAARRLDASTFSADVISVINALLGRASCVDLNAPRSDYKFAFPKDHHLHLDMGTEWYWIACTMQVSDQAGNKGRLAMLLSMGKSRAVGLTAQGKAGWTDEQATIAGDTVTLTLDMGQDKKSYYRRSRNVQWPLKGGRVNFSKPGDAFFSFQCGADSLAGSGNVLPLQINVVDADNMRVDLTLTNAPIFSPEKAFFLQGLPDISGRGTGVTPNPTPGLYYSWPQVQVSGSVTIEGAVYQVGNGSAWIDHQLMMASLQNQPTLTDPQGIHPVPFVEDPKPYNGWLWEYFNLQDGRAFTGVAFLQGQMTDKMPVWYGYLVSPNNGMWDATYMLGGDLVPQNPAIFPALTCNTPAYQVPAITIPIARKFENLGLLLPTLSGEASPWYTDGTFNFPQWSLCAEFPADFKDTSGNYADGVGFLETVGFQPVADYRSFALAFLTSGVYPCADQSPRTASSVQAKKRSWLWPWMARRFSS